MAKGNGGTRQVGPGRSLSPLIGGTHDPELTDSIRDYFLPQSTRDKIDEISKLRTFSQIQDYFRERGIELKTDSEELQNNRRDEYLRPVAETGQKLAVAIEAYKDVFGDGSLNKLHTIVIGDATLPNTASYHYNEPGENDPLAGTLRIKGYSPNGYMVFHELAHAYQDTMTGKGKSLGDTAARMVQRAGLDKKFKAYSGANTSPAGIDAERMADAMGYGFALGSKTGLAFIEGLRKSYNKK